MIVKICTQRAAVISLVFGVFLAAPASHAKLLEKIYAVVNGETITLTEIKDYQKKLKSGGFLNDLLFGDPSVREKALKDRDFLVKLLVDEKIIDYEIKQQGLLVTQERVQKEVKTIAKRQNLSVPGLKRALRTQGVDFKEYQNFIKKSVERRQLVEKEITSKIKISEQDIVSQYLARNSGGKSQIFEYNISHILLGAADKTKAKELADKIKAGASFESLVSANSIDSDSKSKQGQFGSFTSGEMLASIEKAIKDLSIGETSVPVKTAMGWHIFKVNDKKLVKDPAIEGQKQALYQQLFAKAFKEQLDFWLSQKRKDAIIQVNKS